MDSLTHLAIGACLGEALAGKKLGKKAMAWGAVAHSMPDMDVVTALWMDMPSSLLAHRGLTHSLFFALLIIPLLAWTAKRWHQQLSMRQWLVFFSATWLLHLFLDVFNNYGIGWLEPFDYQRFSINAVYVADPFFALGPVMAGLMLLLLKRKHPKRQFWWKFGLLAGAIYLSYCTFNKVKIDSALRAALEQQNILYTRYFSTPAPLQNWCWFVVAGNDAGYHVGYRSLFDQNSTISFQYFPRNDSLLAAAPEQTSIKQLKQFSQEFYTVEKWSDTLVFNDLRFGQVVGWQNPRERFAFHYFMNYPGSNRTVVQRGRFAKWDKNAAASLWERIKGK